MGLGNPAALWLLLLVAVLLLARRRRPASARAVGNLHLWRDIAPTSTASFVARLRRSWLLLLQLAFVLAAVAALVRPTLPPSSRNVAIIVDVSASMGARHQTSTRLDAAIQRAAATIESLPAGARVHLIAAGSAPRRIGDYGARDAALSHVLHTLELTDEHADLSSAIQVARAEGASAGAIYVFSDGDGPPRDGGTAGINWIDVGQSANNAAIVNLSIRRLTGRPEDGQVLVEARNYGAAPIDADVEIAQNGIAAAREPVQLAPNTSETIVTELRGIGGVVSARLQVDDALAADNVRLAIAPPVQETRVLLVGSGFFLEQALASNPTVVVDRDPSRTHDVVVCGGCTSAPASSEPVLLTLSTLRPLHAVAPLALTAPEHPIAKGLSLTGLSVSPVAREDGVGNGEVIARAGGEPAVVAYESPARRVLELRFDPNRGDLPIDTAFPILIANAIDWLTARTENVRDVTAGRPLDRVMSSRPGQSAPRVIGPDGRQHATTRSGNHVVFAATSNSGLYRLATDGLEEIFVVNPTIEGESNLAEGPQRLAEPVEPTGRVTPRTTEITAPLLLLCTALFGVEWWYRLRRMGRL